MYIFDWSIGLIGRMFANGLGDRDIIPGVVLPKKQKMALDTSYLHTQHLLGMYQE